MKTAVLAVVVAVAALLGAFLLFRIPKGGNGEAVTPPPPPPVWREVAVAMTKDGFMPNKATIRKGDTVKFVNEDVQDRWPASNIHPTHDIYPEFDPQRALKLGESWSFTFTKEGIWRYHDHLLPSLSGTIVAE